MTRYRFTNAQLLNIQALDAADGELGDSSPHQYYDRDGQPITFGEWAVMFEDLLYRQVALDQVAGKEVSTLWLGMNHSHDQASKILYESAIDSRPVKRYSTEEDALAGHKAIVDELKHWEQYEMENQNSSGESTPGSPPRPPADL